jgi:hypothetical protein
VQAVESFPTSRVPVFNLLVARTHSYRVGQGGILVHNGDCSSESESSSDEGAPDSNGVTREEKRAIRDWSFKSQNFRALSIILARHPELATASYADAEAQGWLTYIDLGHSGIPGLTREREFEQLRRRLLVDIPTFIDKSPKHPGTVYRGLSSVPLVQIETWRQNSRDGEAIELGINGGPGYASATDKLPVATRFARTTAENRVGVVLEIEQHSGVSLSEVSLAKSEKEVLIPVGARFRIASIEGGPPARGPVKVHLVEL